MIKLTEIKTTSPFGAMRKKINDIQAEIMGHQPVMAKCNNVSADAYRQGTLIASVTASNVTNTLNALVMPEENGTYVCALTGSVTLSFASSGITTDMPYFDKLTIDIASMSFLGNTRSTFVSPSHLNLSHTLMSDGKEAVPVQCTATSPDINLRTVMDTGYTVWKTELVTNPSNPQTLEVQLSCATSDSFPGVPIEEATTITLTF